VINPTIAGEAGTDAGEEPGGEEAFGQGKVEGHGRVKHTRRVQVLRAMQGETMKGDVGLR